MQACLLRGSFGTLISFWLIKPLRTRTFADIEVDNIQQARIELQRAAAAHFGNIPLRELAPVFDFVVHPTGLEIFAVRNRDGVLHPHNDESEIRQVGIAQVGATQVGTDQVGIAQVGTAQVGS